MTVSLEPGSAAASASAWVCVWENVQTQKITFALDLRATKQRLNRACIQAYAHQSSSSSTWRDWPQRACTQHASQAVGYPQTNQALKIQFVSLVSYG